MLLPPFDLSLLQGISLSFEQTQGLDLSHPLDEIKCFFEIGTIKTISEHFGTQVVRATNTLKIELDAFDFQGKIRL